ncbi:MAG: branched-chain amino acid ABC transporter permease [Halobacteriales archaeon]
MAIPLIEPTILAQLLVFGLLLGGIYGFTALGLTIIFGVMDVINVAHGALMVVGMYTVWHISTAYGVSPFLAIPVAVVLSFALGVVIYRATLAPVIEKPAASSLVVTLGLLLVITAVVELRFSATPRSLDYEPGSIAVGDIHVLTGQLYAVLIALAAFVAVWLLLHRTHLGRAIRGTADNRAGAIYVGLNVARIDYLTFGLGAALAGLAGALIPLIQPFDPFLGNQYLTIAFVVVVLGGLGSIPGALLGGLVIGMIHVFGSFLLPGSAYEILIFLLFILVLLFKPTGLLGSDSG